jgi:threonine/homoserine/homoserine lactone efflux protein
MLTYLILGMTYAFAAAVQPGPIQAYLVSQALSHGWRRTIPAAFSPLVSDGPIIVLVLLVLSRVPAGMMLGLRGAGGIFLLYLAFIAMRTWRHFDQGTAQPAPSGRQNLLRATLVNLLNPGPYLGWSLVMGPLLLKGWREAPAHGIALVVAFYATMVLTQVGIVVLFATARGLGPRVNRVLVGVSAVALACFGVFQLWSCAVAYR